MKVLIADFDLFTRVGGGQTFYRSIIEKNSNIDFYYLIKDEKLQLTRPFNAHPIVYKEKIPLSVFKRFYDISPPQWTHNIFTIATNIAASVANQEFDIVEFPDYEQFGFFLRPALNYFSVKFGRIVLCMHGRISTTIKTDWFNPGYQNIPLDLQEEIQYKAADIRYAYSKSYIDELKQEYGIEAEYFSPTNFFNFPSLNISETSQNTPTLNFIGRTEKRKGPDLFVNLLTLLPQHLYQSANIFGPDSFNYDGSDSSSSFLASMIIKRKLAINHGTVLNRDELAKVFASKSVTFLPSRYDTLNLLALESLFSGCPTIVGSGAGVCRFLREEFSKIPFIEMNVDNIYECLPKILYLLSNYEDYRANLEKSLSSINFQASGKNLAEIYSVPSYSDSKSQELSNTFYSQLASFVFGERLDPYFAAQQRLITNLKPLVKPVLKRVKQALVSKAYELVKPLKEDPNPQIFKSLYLFDGYRYCSNLPEFTLIEQSQKLKNYWELAEFNEMSSLGIRAKVKRGYRIDRVRLWRELARIEAMRGNELVAATYKIRGLRLLGKDYFGDLNWITNTLSDHGFNKESLVIKVMYGSDSEALKSEQCFELIQESYLDHLSYQEKEYELVEDNRKHSSYRVSIIVSMYNASTKLPLFLKALKMQTMLARGEAELILIDSGSPDTEYKVLQELKPELDFCIVYARSQGRETIQSAWNRGISLSKAPYLTFLGVDETIVPNCLDILADELDQDSTLDWVTGNSLVTNVDHAGRWLSDVMLYDRHGYNQDLVYLETCYLSWVGSLYRKSIHTRFGYYDASFRATGDNEFKNRILPYIKSKAIDQNLGIFWNYPDERTTQSPIAEIEDMRAWYLYRTQAGVRYAFKDREVEEIENLIYFCLAYRKSYCQHVSTDIDHAYNLSLYLQQISPSSPALKYLEGIKKLLDAYRELDFIPQLSQLTPAFSMMKIRGIVKQVETDHRRISTLSSFPQSLHYNIFNDNRYEQHSFLWITELDSK